MNSRAKSLVFRDDDVARPLPFLPAAARFRGMRIGLLGGSFNPAHDGHRHISLAALKRLGLDEVWWLVSPLNPLKAAEDMLPLEERLAHAVEMAQHPRIRVSAIERRFRTRYSIDTLERLRAVAPGVHFVWLMGADNLAGFSRWRRWRDIVDSVPLAVLDRPRYSLQSLTGAMVTRYRRQRLPNGELKSLATTPAPAWTFISLRRHPASATTIRETRRAAARSSAPPSP